MSEKLILVIWDQVFLKHRQKLNKQLISNSAAMLDAVENLQEVHKKIMKTNEEIIKFNSEIINLSTKLLADENLDSNYNLDSEAINIELESLEKQCIKSKRDCEKLTKKVFLKIGNIFPLLFF